MVGVLLEVAYWSVLVVANASTAVRLRCFSISNCRWLLLIRFLEAALRAHLCLCFVLVLQLHNALVVLEDLFWWHSPVNRGSLLLIVALAGSWCFGTIDQHVNYQCTKIGQGSLRVRSRLQVALHVFQLAAPLLVSLQVPVDSCELMHLIFNCKSKLGFVLT